MPQYSMMPGGPAEDDEMLNPEEQPPVAPVAPVAPEVPADDPRLTAALEQQRKLEMYSGLLKGFQQIASSKAIGYGHKPEYAGSEILSQAAKQPVEQYKAKLGREDQLKKEKIETEKFGMEKEKFGMDKEQHGAKMDAFQQDLLSKKLDFTNEQLTSDPASEESKAAQDRVLQKQKELGQPLNEQSVRGQSAKQLSPMFKYLQEDAVHYHTNVNKQLDRDSEEKRGNLDRQSREKISAEDNAAKSADRKAAIQEKLDATNEKRTDKKVADAKLSDKQTSEVASHDKAIGALDDIIAQKANWDTGKLSMGMNKAASWIGMDDSQKSAFKSEVGEQLASYIKSISGATVSPSERASLLENVPSVYDNDETFSAKAQSLKKRMERNREIEIGSLSKQGKNVEAFQPSSDFVMMQAPDGSPPVKVKKGQEQKYLDKGAQIVK